LGLADYALSKIAPEEAEKVRKIKQISPWAAGLGEIGGTIASAVLPFGPVAKLGQLGARGGTALAAKIGAREALPVMGRALTEGAVIGAGGSLSKQSLEGKGVDPGELAESAAVGAAVSGVLSMAGLGIRAVGRKIKARATANAAAAEEASLGRIAGIEAEAAGLQAEVDLGRVVRSEMSKLKGQMGQIEKKWGGYVTIEGEADELAKLMAHQKLLKKKLEEAGRKTVGYEASKATEIYRQMEAELKAIEGRMGPVGAREQWHRLAKQRDALKVKVERGAAAQGELTALKQESAKVQQQIFDARKDSFEASGRVLSHVGGAAGLVAGLAADGLLMGIVGGGIGSWLIRRMARGAIAKGAPKLISDLGKLAPLAAPGRSAATKILSYAHIDGIREQTEDVDPREVGEAARQGYAEAGLDPIMVDDLANFQQQRVVLMQQIPYMLTPRDRVRWSRILNALEDPRRMTRRITSFEMTREDKTILQIMFPKTYEQLRLAADEVMREQQGKMRPKQLNMLRMLARPEEQARLAQWTQRPPQRRPAGKPTGAAGSGQSKTDLQRVQGGLGK
jgi:hypothetical protein